MSIRNFDALFRPRSVAVFGASVAAHAVGRVVTENLLAGEFRGPLYPVNPKYDSVCGRRAFPDAASLPEAPDLAVICTPAPTVCGIIGELAARGTRAAIVISAGFGEIGTEEGRRREKALLETARPSLFRIVGPNCIGMAATPVGLNASFAPGKVRKGGIAFVAQSGAIVTTMLDWAEARGIGFSYLVSLGNMADVDFGDMLDFLARDPDTRAILLYIEAITQARKFMSAARAAARLKPVIAIKAGRHSAGARAAASHTGALAGMDEVYRAAFRRAGIVRVLNLEELFDAVSTLSAATSIASDDLVILTNGGGPGVLATDDLLDAGGFLTELAPETLARLDARLPPAWSHANPVDILGDATPERYASALSALLEAPEAKAILVINCPTALTSSVEAADAVAKIAVTAKKPILTNWLGAVRAGEARAVFDHATVPTYETPGQAVRGFMHLVHYRRGQEVIIEAPSSLPAEFEPDETRARAIVRRALEKAQGWLRTDLVREILNCYRIPAARIAFAATPEEAAAQAAIFGASVALKISSPDIVHKADVGGVALDLTGEAEARAAAEAMLSRLAELRPDARIEGFLVQEMVRRPGAYELILGASVDRQFGPFILFGEGGSAVEVVADKALALPPLNLRLAHELIDQTRIVRLLRGFRHRPPVALNDIALTLVKLSQLISDLDEIAECEINPLLADEHGVIAVDARIRVERPPDATSRGSRLALRPYPKELERDEEIAGIGTALLRPVRPEDAQLVQAFVSDLPAEDSRLRFFGPLKHLDLKMLARLTQIDYDREMAFLLLQTGRAEKERLLAIVHIAADPDNIRAEFAIIVRKAFQGRGIGQRLLLEMIDYARSRGIKELFGDVLAENARMLALCRDLGFTLDPTEHERITRATLRLM